MSRELDAIAELASYVATGKQPRITLTYDAAATQTIKDAATALRNAEERLVTLEAVRAWYADPGNYLRVPLYTQIAADKGERARDAAPTVGD